METATVKSGSKWISLKLLENEQVTLKPLYGGDLIHNNACYYPFPEKFDDFWRLLSMNAEDFTYDDARFKWGYDKQAMIYASASSGWFGRRMAERFSDQVLRHSVERLTNESTPFFSDQRLADVLDPQVMAKVYKHNYDNNDRDARVAAQHMRDVFIYAPVHREEFLRSIGGKHALTRGAFYEDITFEVHFWGPRLIHRDTTHGIYVGDHAWSRNGALEKALGAAIQYGDPQLMDIRMGETFHKTDIYNRPISIFDQACEDARHLVYEVGRPVFDSDGQAFERRSDTAAALLLSRFAYDRAYRNEAASLDKSRVNESVKAHYASAHEMERMAHLQRLMLPFLAQHCNTPTLKNIRAHDPFLDAAWEEMVLPSLKNKTSSAEYAQILSYIPRGGFEERSILKYAQTLSDSPQPLPVIRLDGKAPQPPANDVPDVPNGLPKNPFSCDWDPGIYNDRGFARLGQTSNPQHAPDNDHLTFAQAACEMKINTALSAGIRPYDKPHRVLYLDDPAGGVRAALWKQEKQIDNPSEMSAKFDAFAQGGEKFSESVARETGDDFKDRVRDLALGEKEKSWRAHNKIGLIDTLSDIKASLDYTGRREAHDTERHEALAAYGAMHVPPLAVETMARRLIGLEENGLILPAGHLTDLQLWCCSEGLSAALGKSPRAYSGGKYKFDFFMDYDHWKPSSERGDPEPMDLADMVIHLGLMAKADLEKPDPARRQALYVVLARFLDAYERVLDPTSRNQVTLRDEFTGADSIKTIIDLKQVKPEFLRFMNYDSGLFDFVHDPNLEDRLGDPEYNAFFKDPEYLAFKQPEKDKQNGFYASYASDPVEKARLAKMIWAYMRAEVQEVGPGQAFVVPGNLTLRGIRNFDHAHLTDLHRDYREAHRAWHNLSAHDRANIFKQQQTHIGDPGLSLR